MQEQLKRIKNKDLSSLDDRLFGNIDKVETINSTLQNLQHFQQFLLAQISQFEEETKHKNNNNQIKEVIQQNCNTLRESIMRAVPDLQNSNARFRQQISSPINGFRSTRQWKLSNNTQMIQNKNLSQKENNKKLQQIQTNRKITLKKVCQLKQEISQLKLQFKQIRSQNVSLNYELRSQFQKCLKQKFQVLSKQKQKLRQQCEKLKKQKQELSHQNQTFKTQLQKFKKKQTQRLFQTDLLFSNKMLFESNQQQKSCAMSRSMLRQNERGKFKEIQNYLQTANLKVQSQDKYLVNKLKLDFTSKLNKFGQCQTKFKQNQSSHTAEFQQRTQTFRTSNNISLSLNNFQSNSNSRYAFRSIQLPNETRQKQHDPNVPKLLKRNSIISNYRSDKVSEQYSTTKHRLPLEDIYFNAGAKSNYQSVQKCYRDKQEQISSINHQSTGKKSNHDIMRKTKSNFFKKQLQNTKKKQNFPIYASPIVHESNVTKLKGLTDISNGDRKKHGQSKQKLKIFSMI